MAKVRTSPAEVDTASRISGTPEVPEVPQAPAAAPKALTGAELMDGFFPPPPPPTGKELMDGFFPPAPAAPRPAQSLVGLVGHMSIPDAMDAAAAELAEKYNNHIPKAVLVARACQLSGRGSGSVIPTDFCYNRVNKGSRPQKYWCLLWEGNTYAYVGRGYVYQGPVIQAPRSF